MAGERERPQVPTNPSVLTDYATATKQSDGSQKTQVVDGSGNVVGSTGNALNVNITNASIATTGAAPTTIVAFVTTVTTAGTRVQLASNTIIAGILQAPSTNTGNVYIGGATVSNTVFGAELQPGQSVGIAISNTDKIYIDAASNGDKVAFLGS